MAHHSDDRYCSKCVEILKGAHYFLVAWFWKVKARHPNVHVSCAFRSQDAQNQAVSDGKSQLAWPKSAHNHVNTEGLPESRALDLFQIDEDGVARWSPIFMAKLNSECEADKEPLLWGGHYKSLGDSCHFNMDVAKMKRA